MKIDILDAHKACLNFLLECQMNDDEFFFIPRKINNKHRLEKGMYFLGSEKYLVLSFWDGSDTKEHIYNIGWSCNANGESFIDLSCRDDDKKLPYILEIKELLEKTGKKFDNNKKDRWRCCYPEEEYFLDTLEEFVFKEKPLIDDYLKNHPESGIPLADRDIDDKYVKTLPYYTEYMNTIKKLKKTGNVRVRASEYMMSLQHNELSNNMVAYLKNHGYKKVKQEDHYVDITCKNAVGEKIFFELKTAQTVRSAIREALGQLLEYNHYPNEKKADKLIIVTKLEPEKADVQYLNYLRETYKIPVYYQYFDMNQKVLSELF